MTVRGVMGRRRDYGNRICHTPGMWWVGCPQHQHQEYQRYHKACASDLQFESGITSRLVSLLSSRCLSVALSPNPRVLDHIITVRTQPRLAVDAATAHTATAATLPYGLRVAARAHLGVVVGDVS